MSHFTPLLFDSRWYLMPLCMVVGSCSFEAIARTPFGISGEPPAVMGLHVNDCAMLKREEIQLRLCLHEGPAAWCACTLEAWNMESSPRNLQMYPTKYANRWPVDMNVEGRSRQAWQGSCMRWGDKAEHCYFSLNGKYALRVYPAIGDMGN